MTQEPFSPGENGPMTDWSLIKRAVSDRSSVRRASLDAVIHRYYPLLKWQLVVRQQLSATDADDVLQAFVADKLLERNLLSKADPSRGRFRSLLITCLNNYTQDWRRRERAAGRRLDLPLEADASVAVAEAPADPFDLLWACRILTSAGPFTPRGGPASAKTKRDRSGREVGGGEKLQAP